MDSVSWLSQTCLEATSHTHDLAAMSISLSNHQTHSHVRRGSGGSAPASAALGSFKLETKVFTAFSTIVPAELAASYITDFLDIIALRIETGFWSHEPLVKYRVIHMWDFELSFYSLNTVIPWDFIQAYVIDLSDYVGRGFVGTFDEYMIGMMNGVTTAVTVKLKMLTKDPPMVLT
ncbi:MAG: hypothetical protein Q9195_007875 [Heterodermia aff. obscurata]